MTDRTLIFDLPGTLDADAIEAALTGPAACGRDAAERLTLCYLDTFDWRLHNAGEVLECIVGGGETRLRLRLLGTGDVQLEQRVERAPRFASDLVPGELRRRLEQRADVRALLPGARARVRRTVLRVLDSADKTVLRLELYEGSAQRTGRWLQLVPVRGYEKAFERSLRRIERRLECRPAPCDPMAALSQALPRPPADYDARHSVRLDAGERADAACKRILGELAEVIAENEEGVVGDVDSEFLHDYRVAMRRTRSLIGQVKGVFPESRLAPFRDGLRWLSDMTGPPRDADVYLLGFGEHQAAVPVRLRPALEPLRDELALVKGETYAALAKAIASARYRRLMASWRRFLAAPVPVRPASPNAARPIGDVARARTWRVFRRALAEGRAIDDSTPAEALHELRKTCKKLRYLVEFFRSLFPDTDVAHAIRILKRLQDVLGDFQDFEVQQAKVAGLRARMEARGVLETRTARALDALVRELGARQARSRESFAARFAAFDTREHRRLYRALYRPHRTARAAG